MAPSAIHQDEANHAADGPLVDVSDVCIVGAGPAGLMLADNLARFGVKATVVDERPDQTSAGRADGLQPKTIETLRMLRLADDLIRVSAKVHDIAIWGHDDQHVMQRQGREIHYPDSIVDVLDPYILLCHQGMVEGAFLKAMRERGIQVQRSTTFEAYKPSKAGDILDIQVQTGDQQKTFKSKYLVGCDGAHSKVRKSIPGSVAEGSSSESVWGVLDGKIDTDFPDLFSKTILVHPYHGAVLIIPRERGMTRFYIELKSDASSTNGSSAPVTQETVMERARLICAPYRLDWTTVEWFGRYQIGQRVASKFTDDARRAFIAGDASHTHSPKAAQGMNTSIHDSWNLAWKLNFALRGLTGSNPALLDSYEHERRKIAQDLIRFDYEHANQVAGGDSKALAENFRTNMGFISGVGVKYADNILNQGSSESLTFPTGVIRPGSILPPARAIRHVDHNPVHIQLDIPILGQFRIYFLVRDVTTPSAQSFLQQVGGHIVDPTSLLARLSGKASESYKQQPRLEGEEDVYFCHDRYTAVSNVFTPALITASDKSSFELAGLPSPFSNSPWTVYLDDAASLGGPTSCIDKWLGDLAGDEIAILNVRPDNYVGSVSRWDAGSADSAAKAAEWLTSYYGGFLEA